MSTTYGRRHGDFAEARMSAEEIAAIKDVPLKTTSSWTDEILDEIHDPIPPNLETQAAGAKADDEVEDAIARGEDPNAEDVLVEITPGMMYRDLPDDDAEPVLEDLSDEELDALTS